MLINTSIRWLALVLLSSELAAASNHWADYSHTSQSSDTVSGPVIRLAQGRGAPNSTQPNTSKSPGGAAERETPHTFAQGLEHSSGIFVTGRILSIKNDVIEIAPEGNKEHLTLTLTPNLLVTVAQAGTLNDIKPGLSVLDSAEGNSLEIIPPKTYSAAIVVANDGHKITTSINNDHREIPIQPNAQISRFTYGSKADLTPGANIYVHLSDHSTRAVSSIAVGKNGITPTFLLPAPGQGCCGP
jgi:hypothetical protein